MQGNLQHTGVLGGGTLRVQGVIVALKLLRVLSIITAGMTYVIARWNSLRQFFSVHGVRASGGLQGGMGLSPNQPGHHIALASEVGTCSILANESSESFARIADRDTCFLFCARSCHYHLATTWNVI